jgi:uncharacterized protein YdgA (DUF945 family)
MKKTIIAGTLIFSIVASIPFASGLLMERTVRNAFADINSMYATTGFDYSLEIISYDRGYSTSDIEWKINLGALKGLYPIDEVVFEEHASHGFAGVVSTTSLEKNLWFADFVENQLQGRNPIHISSKYDLSGKIEATVALDAFSVNVEDETIDVKPGRMVTTTDHNLKHFSSTGNWQGLSVGETLAVGMMTMKSELEKISTYVWDGNMSFGANDIKARENDETVELQAMRCEYLLDLNDDQSSMSGEARFSVDGMHSNNLTVDHASVCLATKGLNVEGYEEFMRMYTDAMSAVVGNMAAFDGDPEKAKQIMNRQMAAIGFQMVAAYEKLMKEGLELRISDLLVNLPAGDIRGDITLRLLKDMTFMQFAPLVAQPELLLDIFYLKSDLSLPVNLTGENPGLLTPVYPGMHTGLFVKNGENLIHQAETINGRLMVNSEEVVLSPASKIQPTPASIDDTLALRW